MKTGLKFRFIDMNFSPLLGTLVIGVVLFFGVIQTSIDPYVFLNFQSLLLVFGGTLGIALLSFPMRRIQDVLDFLIYGIFLKRKTDDIKNVIDMIRMAHFYQINRKEFIQHVNCDYIFLQEAAVLLAQERMSPEEVQLILQNRKNSFKKKYIDEYKMLLAISKFPPGLGLLGASVHMIEMMMQFSATGLDSVSASMASALVSTFWGIACANLIFLPLTDYAQRVAEEDLFSRDLVIHGIVMTKQGYPVSSISEAMISELPIAEQMMLRSLIFKSQQPNPESKEQNPPSQPEVDPNFFVRKTRSPNNAKGKSLINPEGSKNEAS